MTTTVLFIYSLISGAILSLLWLVFRLAAIDRLTSHRLNRLLLVTILVVSVGLPAIAFIERPAEHVGVIEIEPTAEIEVLIDELDIVAASSVPGLGDRIVALLPLVYITGLAVAVVWLLIGLCGVAAAIIYGEKRRLDRHTTLVVHRRNVTPFTWGKWVVISQTDLEENATMLIVHEQAHRAAAHWLDLLFARVVACLDWYWPTAWLLNRDLSAVHEYQADSRVLDGGADAATYQMLLINRASSTPLSAIANSFNYNSLKKRITMMQRNQSSALSRMRYFAMFPATLLAIAFSSAPALASAIHSRLPEEKNENVVDQKQDDIQAVYVDRSSRGVEQYGEIAKNGVINVTTKNAPTEITAQIPAPVPNAEVMVKESVTEARTREIVSVQQGMELIEATFPGGDQAMYPFLTRHIRYPEEAVKKNIQGRVIMQFRVLKDGSIDSIKVFRGVDPLLDAEAIRVVKTLPKFNPAKQNGEPVNSWYTLPLSFKLQSDAK